MQFFPTWHYRNGDLGPSERNPVRRQSNFNLKAHLFAFWRAFVLMGLRSDGTYELKAMTCLSLSDYNHDAFALLLMHKCTQRNNICYNIQQFFSQLACTSRVTTRKPSWRKGKRATAVRVWRPTAKKSTANFQLMVNSNRGRITYGLRIARYFRV